MGSKMITVYETGCYGGGHYRSETFFVMHGKHQRGHSLFRVFLYGPECADLDRRGSGSLIAQPMTIAARHPDDQPAAIKVNDGDIILIRMVHDDGSADKYRARIHDDKAGDDPQVTLLPVEDSYCFRR